MVNKMGNKTFLMFIESIQKCIQKYLVKKKGLYQCASVTFMSTISTTFPGNRIKQNIDYWFYTYDLGRL